MAYPSGVSTGVVELSRASRTWRTLVVLGLTTMFCLGSIIGDDPWWPFSPWRMFSTSTKATGSVISTEIEVRTPETDGQWVPGTINPWTVGINRAELEGRMEDVKADPSQLGTLAESHAVLKPSQPEWTGIRVVRRQSVIVDRKPTGEKLTTVVVTWEKP